MERYTVELSRILELFNQRQVNQVTERSVIGFVGCLLLQFDTLTLDVIHQHRISLFNRLCVLQVGFLKRLNAIHLRDMEHAVVFQNRDAVDNLFAVLFFPCLVHLPEHHLLRLLALANLSTAGLPLLVRGVFASVPKHHLVDEAVWLAADAIERSALNARPRLAPRNDSLLQFCYDPVRYHLINIDSHSALPSGSRLMLPTPPTGSLC